MQAQKAAASKLAAANAKSELQANKDKLASLEIKKRMKNLKSEIESESETKESFSNGSCNLASPHREIANYMNYTIGTKCDTDQPTEHVFVKDTTTGNHNKFEKTKKYTVANKWLV